MRFEGYKRGVNFGGWLSQCDHTKRRYDTYITEDDFKKVASRKFDHVRIPVDYELFEDNNLNIDESRFSYIDFAVDMCKKYNLKMVLDLHRTPGYSFDPFHEEKGFFEDEDLQEHFYKIWETFAKHYGKYSDMLTFELLNEVTKKDYCEKWNNISTECIKRIRVYAPDTFILLGGYHNNSLEAVRDLAMPYDDKVVYNFHCYEPLIFTHQGATWIASMNPDFRCHYKMPYSKYIEYSEKELNQAYAKLDIYDTDAMPDENYFEELLKDAILVAKERNVSLYCGEYGVIDKADREDAQLWFNDFHAVMDKNDIGRAVWSYKQMDFEISEDF